MSTGYIDIPGSGSGVTSLNSLAGALTLVAGSGIVITDNGVNQITISSPDAGGTVTSVGLAAPSFLTVSGSPVTTSGTLTLTLTTQSANTVFAGPTSGGAAAPTFRSLVTADLPAGTGTVTSVAMTVPTFLSVSGSPITTAGTLAVTLSGTALPIANGGTAGTTAAAAFNNLSPMTTGGDLIYGGASGVGTRLANGSAGNFLQSGGGTSAPSWYDSANLKIAAIEFIIDGGGDTITTGIKGDLEIPFACTITRATLLADQTGSIVVDIWKDTYANYPPTGADSITASAIPTISSATKSQDSTLTGWTTSIAAGDTLRFNVNSVTTIQRVTLSLRVTKT